MSDAPIRPPLDTCGCCEGQRPHERITNAPALPALRYRISTHSEFLERVLHALPLATGDSTVARPLSALASRTADDPTVAFIDACATIADVLTFYQERIANEGYLRTATERRSVLELARAIGYELSPGVAASVYLAFTVEDAPGAPLVCELAQGTQVQSVPPQGKLPQVFETSAAFVARAEWNALRPRLTRPAEFAVLDTIGSPGAKRLHLLGPSGTFPDNVPGLMKDLDPDDVHRLDTAPPSAPTMDALEVRRIYLTEAAAGLAKGDLLLFVGRRGSDTSALVLRVTDVAEEPDRKRVRVDLKPLPAPGVPEPTATSEVRFAYRTKLGPVFASVGLAPLALNLTNVHSEVVTQKWRERDLQALIGIQRWQPQVLVKAVNRQRAPEPIVLDAGAFSFRERAAFFGHTAPKWKSLPATNTKGNPYPEGWDEGDSGPGSPPGPLPHPRAIWTDSQGVYNPTSGPHVYLERPMKGLVDKSWVVFESPNQAAEAFAVADAREASRADFGISGRAMALTLRNATGSPVPPSSATPFRFRTTTAHAASRRLEFVELPIETPIERGSTQVELDWLVLGLTAGQAIALIGERSDLPGVEAAEVGSLKDIVHQGGRTTLLLEDRLEHSYVRHTLVINANVVHATHGETVTEVLGSGNGTVANQRFDLKKPPLTYVLAPTPRGARSALEVRVNRVKWDEVPSLYPVSSERQCFIVRVDDDGRASVTFGDGEHGARVPTGMANVMATYRSGIGTDGEVEAGTLTLLRSIPLGLRSVSNPLPAGGAEDPERLELARVNAPLTVLTFERVVSLQDYEDFSRTFPGIGKARAHRLSVDGRDVVHVTVAGASGKEPDANVLEALVTAIEAAGDRSQAFKVSPFAQRYFTVAARIVVNPRYVADEVLALVEQHLRDSYAFDTRDFGQSVTPSEVLARIHEVEGVVAVDLETLAPYDQGVAPPVPGTPPEPVAARRAQWNPETRTFEAAELLLINPVGIDLEEMK